MVLRYKYVFVLFFSLSFTINNLFAEKINKEYTFSTSANEIFNIKNENDKSKISLNRNFISQINQSKNLIIKNLQLTEGKFVNLELTKRKSIVDEKIKFLTQTKTGEMKLNAPNVIMYSGTIDGYPEEKANLIIIDNLLFGAVLKNDVIQYFISPNLTDGNTESEIVSKENFPNDIKDLGCLTDNLNKVESGKYFKAIEHTLSNELLELELAVGTDTEFFKATGGNTALAQAYAIAIFSMVDVIYEEQLNISIKLSWLKNWTDNPADPYNVKGNAYALPDTVRIYWKENYSDVQRDVFHVMTSISYGGGGFGYFDALCDNKEYGFSVSSVQASHSFPIMAFNYDVYIVAHELGHNFNGQHTHSCYFGSPTDTCITTDAINGGCLDASITPRPNPGSIMSYCGGTNNQFGLGYQVKMVFDEKNAVLMRNTAEQALCLTAPSEPEVVLQNPNNNQSFKTGDYIPIKWNSSGVDNIGIYYTIDNGINWFTIADSVFASDNLHYWVAPKMCSSNIKLRLFDISDNSVADTSVIPFSIYADSFGDTLAFYPFNKNAANSICGGFPDGILKGSPQAVPDRYGNPNSAFSFSSGNYIFIPDADLNHNEITVAFWFKGENSTVKKFFIGTNSGPALNVFEIYHWGALGCTFYLKAGLYQCWAGWPEANTWKHAAFTYDGDTAKAYINGVLTMTEEKPGPLLNFTTSLYIGSRKGSEPYSGAIDDIYIFKKVLSEGEIASMYYDNPFVPEKPNLLSPLDSSLISNPDVNFIWDWVANTKYYHFQLSDNNDFVNYPLPVNDSLLKDTTFAFDNHVNGKTYYWRVKSGNFFGSGRWSDVFSFIFDSVNNVEDYNYESSIIISPIPASEILEIMINNLSTEHSEIIICDELGHIVKNEIIDYPIFGKHKLKLDISGISTGIYFLKFQSKDISIVKKIIIIK